MSDYISQGSFEVLWTDIMMENDGADVDVETSVVEISTEEFVNKYGVDVSVFDQEMFEESVDAVQIDLPNIPTSSSSTSIPVVVTTEDSNQQPISSTSNENVESEKDHFKSITSADVRKQIEESENKNTVKKTLMDVSKFRRFLGTKNEKRDVEAIPPDELDEYLANYILAVRKKDGGDYEPSTLRNMISSIDRKLNRHKYPVRIMQEGSTNHFQLTRDALKAKQRGLKKLGKGNKPNAASPITDEELNMLYEKGILGGKTPKSLLNTVWFNNCVHLGLRGTTENYNLRWGDITQQTASNGIEYLELNERQTKTRTGNDLSDVRQVKPKLWATAFDPERCPVEMYKLYKQKRPTNFCDAEHPFYIAPRTTTVSNGYEQWFTKNPVGEKKMGTLLKTMCQEGSLDSNKNMTNHATRKRLVSKLRESGIAPTDIMQISGHKNVQSILNYSSMSESKHQEISNILSNTRPETKPKVTHTCVHAPPSPPTVTIVSAPSSSTSAVVSSIATIATTTDLQNVVDRIPTFPTHQDRPRNTVNMPSLSLRNDTNTQLQSLFGGANVNIQQFNVYMH